MCVSKLGHERLASWPHFLGSFVLGEASHHVIRKLKQLYREVHVEKN